MKAFISGLLAAVLLWQTALASPKQAVSPLAPQPSACIGSEFSSSGDQWWQNITLKLTNNCGRTVDFQNASITFENRIALDTSFWGDFGPLSYPDGNLRIASQQQSNGNYLATINLHFPTYQGANSKLPTGSSISIKYGAKSAGQVAGTTRVYVESPVDTGAIQIRNTSSKPANVSQTYAVVHVTMNGRNVSDVQVPWSGMQTVSGLAAGTYAITADSVADSSGNNYQATVTPPTVNLTAGQTANVSIAYAAVQQSGRLAINLQTLPTQLAGYTGKPTVNVREAGSGSGVPVTLDWGASATVSSLKAGSSYNFTTPVITHNGFTCQPTFAPTSVVASAGTPPVTNLTYTCTQVAQSRVTLNVSGAPSSLASLSVTLTPNNGGSAVNQAVSLTNGSGSSTVMLTTGTVYTVSAAAVSGYTISFNPQPLTASANAVEAITLTQASSGDTPVAQHGQLTVCGTQLCDEHGTAVQLKGMSSHGIQWFAKCLTAGSLDALAKDFKASVFRIAMYIQEGGYETDPTGFTNQVNALIEEGTKRGMYVIVDWHMLTPGDPNYNLARARTFFTAIANTHKNKNNIIYEIANEPNGVSWASIKSYAESLIPTIRAIDANAPILIGTRAWSSLGLSEGSNSQEIINNPVNATNIMYTFHFYAASHRDNYLSELDRASSTLPIFATEWGTQTFTGDGENDFAMSQRYIDLMARKKISWANWNYSDDFRSGAIWTTGTCPNGPWTDARLKPAGLWIKEKIQN